MSESERLAAEYVAWSDPQLIDKPWLTSYTLWCRWLATQALDADEASAVLLEVLRKRTMLV
jgi:hypothetical protein